MKKNPPVISGNVLKDHYQWLLSNAWMDEKGQLRCIATDEPMYAQVHHYVRPMGSNAHHPFTETIDAPNGEMLTFKSYGCNRCKAGLPIPAEVRYADVVSLREPART